MSSYREDPERITYFAETDARGRRTRFGIKAKDRSKHIYVIGKTGMGKSTLLENMAIQDIQNGEGLAFIDPHGSTAEKLLDYVPEERVDDVLYFAPFDMDYPIAFNVMEDVGYDKRHLVVSGLMSAFKKIWADQWSSRMEYILTNTLLALLEYDGSTLLDVNRMYVDKVFRKKVIDNVQDPLVKSFWVDEFATYTDRYTQEATPAIQNKVGQFTSNPLIRNIVGQAKSSFDLREMMDTRKIFIVNLSKGRIGETNADLLGSMLTTKIYLSAMSRADLPAQQLDKLPNFYFYVDEFQSIANDSFADILSEARKYKLNLTIAHQYIEQMEENVRNAVFGNVGTTIAFRVGPFDAEVLETVFKPHFIAADLVNLSFAQIYLTLMIDGVGSRPFSAVTLVPIDPPRLSYREKILKCSRGSYCHTRTDVEEEIKARSTPLPAPKEERAQRHHADDRDRRTQGNQRDNRSSGASSGRRRETTPPRENRPSGTRANRGEENTSLKSVLSTTQSSNRTNTQNQNENSKTTPRSNGEHLKELRSTLSRIASESEGKGGEKQGNKETAARPSPTPVAAPQSKKKKVASKTGGSASSHPNEVPEKTLRDILDVEKE